VKRREILGSLLAWPVVRAEPKPSVYLAGPLFSDAERSYLSQMAGVIRGAGFECFVPHEHPLPQPASAAYVFKLDRDALDKATAMVAWVDGPDVDSGTACEIGLFSELCRRDSARKGIAAIATDLRMTFRKETPGGGMNLFVAGCIEATGVRVANVDAAVEWLKHR